MDRYLEDGLLTGFSLVFFVSLVDIFVLERFKRAAAASGEFHPPEEREREQSLDESNGEFACQQGCHVGQRRTVHK